MPDKLPKGWAQTTLGDVNAPSRQRALPNEVPDLPYVGMEHVESQTMRLIGQGKASDLKSSSVKFSKGDVLYGKMRPYLNKVWLAEFDGLCSAEFLVFPNIEGFNSQLFAYRLNSQDFLNFANHQVSGDRPRVDFEKLAKFPYLLAPSREQERIVAKLDALLSRVAAGEAAARRALERLKRYRAAVLHAAVTGELTRNWRKTHKPEETGSQLLKRLLQERRARWEAAELKRLQAAGKPPKDDKWKKRYPEPATTSNSELPELPRGWIWAGWEQVGFSQNGRPFPSGDYTKRGVKLLRPGNLYSDGSVQWNEKNTRCLPAKFELENPDHIINGDELVINLTAQSLKDEFLGRVCLTSSSEHCLLNQRLARLTPVSGEPKFFLYMFKSSIFRRFVDGLNSGSLIQHMFTYQLGDFGVPLPPETEQVEIVREVERRLTAADRLTATLNRQFERARVTRQSLLREAFAGNLVPQDPKDEPASALLDRIRAAREAAAKLPKAKRSPRRLNKNESATMKQTAPTVDTLRTAWQKIGKKPDAKKLFEATGFTPEQVVRFYELLRSAPEIRDGFEFLYKGRVRFPEHVLYKDREEKEKSKPGHFRLVSLWLEDFKNLKKYEVQFNPEHGLDVVLGWNGTGKSNLFEAFVLIFRDLHYWWGKNHWPDEPMAGYRLVYEVEEHLIVITWDPAQMKRPALQRAAIPTKKGEQPKFNTIKREELPLPRFVFGYYSGPTNRLAEHFLPMKLDHYERLRKASSDSPKTLANLIEQRRFFCAETHHAKYVLLAFSYKEDAKIWSFLEKRLRIVGFESALFIIRKPRWAKGKPEDFWGATGIMRRVMEKLRRFSIAPMVVRQPVSDGYHRTHEDHYYFYIPDLKSLHAFAGEYADARSFFLALESTDFSELIHDVKIQVRVKAAGEKQVPITFRELSEGEQQLLMVLGLMRFTKSYQSLVLLDEPDTHLNPHWGVEYLKDLATVVSDDDNPSPEQQTSQILMATHDPLVIASLVKEQIHLLKRDRDSLHCYWQQASENPRGMGYTGILLSDMFGFQSDLDEETLALLDRQVQLAGKPKKLNKEEKNELGVLNKQIEKLGFKTVSSDPYYRAFVEALARRQETLALVQKPVQTVQERAAIRKAADEILAGLAQKHALHA